MCISSNHRVRTAFLPLQPTAILTRRFSSESEKSSTVFSRRRSSIILPSSLTRGRRRKSLSTKGVLPKKKGVLFHSSSPSSRLTGQSEKGGGQSPISPSAGSSLSSFLPSFLLPRNALLSHLSQAAWGEEEPVAAPLPTVI